MKLASSFTVTAKNFSGRLRQGAETIGKQLTSIGSLGPIPLYLFNNRNEFGDLLDGSIGRKDIRTKFGPQKSELVGCWNAFNLEDRSEGRNFLPHHGGHVGNGWETFLVLAVLPHGCQQIINVAGSDRLYSVVHGIAEENFFN